MPSARSASRVFAAFENFRLSFTHSTSVMAGLDPAISFRMETDARVKLGHDGMTGHLSRGRSGMERIQK